MLFEWSDHSHVTFTQWQTGEPSHTTNFQEDCVLIRGKVTHTTLKMKNSNNKFDILQFKWFYIPHTGWQMGRSRV